MKYNPITTSQLESFDADSMHDVSSDTLTVKDGMKGMSAAATDFFPEWAAVSNRVFCLHVA